jgi:hypothetical protein
MTPSAEPTSKVQAPGYLVPANLLGDNEIIVLAIKPSGWFVLTCSLPVIAAAAVVAAGAYLVGLYRPYGPEQAILSFCAAAALARAVVACWQWVGRTYVLTNHRIICVRGLVNVNVTGAALVEIRRVVMSAAVPERLFGVASLFCLGDFDSNPAVAWNTVSDPQEVQQIIDKAIRRARRSNQPLTGA